MGLNPQRHTARILSRTNNNSKNTRNYDKANEQDICGTADAIIIRNNELIVIDWKTGKTKITETKYNWQMRFLALSAGLIYGIDNVSANLVKISDSNVKQDKCEFDAFDLSSFCYDILDACDRINAPVHPGYHCKYCPAYTCENYINNRGFYN